MADPTAPLINPQTGIPDDYSVTLADLQRLLSDYRSTYVTQPAAGEGRMAREGVAPFVSDIQPDDRRRRLAEADASLAQMRQSPFFFEGPGIAEARVGLRQVQPQYSPGVTDPYGMMRAEQSALADDVYKPSTTSIPWWASAAGGAGLAALGVLSGRPVRRGINTLADPPPQAPGPRNPLMPEGTPTQPVPPERRLAFDPSLPPGRDNEKPVFAFSMEGVEGGSKMTAQDARDLRDYLSRHPVWTSSGEKAIKGRVSALDQFIPLADARQSELATSQLRRPWVAPDAEYNPLTATLRAAHRSSDSINQLIPDTAAQRATDRLRFRDRYGIDLDQLNAEIQAPREVNKDYRTPAQRQTEDAASERRRTEMLTTFQRRPSAQSDNVMDASPSPQAMSYETDPTSWVKAYAKSRRISVEDAIDEARGLGLRLDLAPHRFQGRDDGGRFGTMTPSQRRVFELTRSLDPDMRPTTPSRGPASTPLGGFYDAPQNPLATPPGGQKKTLK